MSIQFRSRIKTAADYKNHFDDSGVCCLPDGTKGDVSYTYAGCMAVSGYFQYVDCEEIDEACINDVSCPSLSETGCCCACKYVDDYDAYLTSISDNESDSVDGLEDDITFCECSHVGGIWAGPGTICDDYTRNDGDDAFSLCTNGASISGGEYSIEIVDRRFPEGCCVELSDGTYDCRNVCSDTACSEEQTSENPDGMASHYPGIPCGWVPDYPDEPISCGDENQTATVLFGGLAVENTRYNNILTSPNPTKYIVKGRYRKTKAGKEGMVSVCIQNKNKNEYECQLTSKDYCDGYWLGLKESGIPYSCNDISDINIAETFMRKGTVARSVVDSWELGEHHIGGFYAGIFNYGGEKSPYESVEGWGNRQTGEGQLYRIERKEGECKEFKSFTENQWVVIVAGSNYLNSVNIGLKKNIIINNTSNFDSIRNMNLPLNFIKKIKNRYIENGFGSGQVYGWALPSLHLSAFIYNQTKNNPEFFTNAILNKNNEAYKWTPMKNLMWTSSLVDGVQNRKLAYVQDFNNGFVSVCDIGHKHDTRLVMLARIDDSC